MTRQLISTGNHCSVHLTRSVRRAVGFVQVPLGDMASHLFERRFWTTVGTCAVTRFPWHARFLLTLYMKIDIIPIECQ